MKINNIKNVRNIKENNNYIGDINKNLIKKCKIQNKKIQKDYYIYYKEDTMNIPIRLGNLMVLELLFDKYPNLLNKAHMFIIINKNDNSELRLLFDSMGKLILPKNVDINEDVKKECIYQFCKIQNMTKKEYDNINIKYSYIFKEVKMNNEKTVFSIK